jgi:hypothetical protein
MWRIFSNESHSPLQSGSISVPKVGPSPTAGRPDMGLPAASRHPYRKAPGFRPAAPRRQGPYELPTVRPVLSEIPRTPALAYQ